MRLKFLFVVASICGSAVAQDRLPGILYFEPSWCPRPEELTALSKFMNIRKNGCCIREALVFGEFRSRPEVLAPWRHRINATSTFDAECTGHILTEQEEQLEQTERFRREQTEAAEAAERARLAALREKQEEAAKRRNLPAALRALQGDDFCRAYGLALRENSIPGIGDYPELHTLVKAEATRRGLRFDTKLVAERKIRLGLSECQLYASWGNPDDQNRSVGKWGIHVQHVYRRLGTNVYTENGTVTSWQD